MSQEEVKRLEQDAKASAEVREKLKDAGAEPAKLAAVASGMGYDVSESDINQYIADKKEAMSADDLDEVSGGGSDPEVAVATEIESVTTATGAIVVT